MPVHHQARIPPLPISNLMHLDFCIGKLSYCIIKNISSQTLTAHVSPL